MVLPGITPKVGDAAWKRMEAHTVIPEALWDVIVTQGRLGWSGTLALNMKDGRIVAYELTEKRRLDQR